MTTLRVALCQLNPVVGDLEGNTAKGGSRCLSPRWAEMEDLTVDEILQWSSYLRQILRESLNGLKKIGAWTDGEGIEVVVEEPGAFGALLLHETLDLLKTDIRFTLGFSVLKRTLHLSFTPGT